MKTTTVYLDEDLLKAVKHYAAENQVTLNAIVDQALRELLTRKTKRAKREPVRLPTFQGRGLQPGVNLNNTAAVLDLMKSDT